MNKIIKFFQDPFRLIVYLSAKGVLRFLPARAHIKLLYFAQTKNKLNLKDPKGFNEKIQWLKLYDYDPIMDNLVDKYSVREYISRNFGEDLLIPIYGVYESFEDLEFDKLPKSFVLKCTHDSGSYTIINNKNEIDVRELKNKYRKLLHRNLYFYAREKPYKNLIPRIICEQNLCEDIDEELIDYKLFCFHSEVKFTMVSGERKSKDGVFMNFYDLNWNRIDMKRELRTANYDFKKPENFDRMVSIAKSISSTFKFVRIDFYEVRGKLFFGEITFYPAAGFGILKPPYYEELLGSWINLNKEK